jgi:class 3 adenylate cyclase
VGAVPRRILTGRSFVSSAGRRSCGSARVVASKCSPLQSSAGSVARRSPGEFSFPSPNLTALFADLKGSTVLIEGLDPEEAQALIDPAVQLMMEAVHRYEGYVAQALGEEGSSHSLVHPLPMKITLSGRSIQRC